MKYKRVELLNFWKDIEKICLIAGVMWVIGFYNLKSSPLLSMVLLFCAGGFSIFATVILIKRIKLFRSDLSEIDKLDGFDFECYLENFFEMQGYRTFRTQYSMDHGADLILEDGRDKIAVQAKRSKYPIGPKAVYEVLGAKKFYKCHRAVVITNNIFKYYTIKEAKKFSVELVGRKELLEYFNKRDKERLNKKSGNTKHKDTGDTVGILGEIFAENKKSPSLPRKFPKNCEICGKELSEKVRRFCYEKKDAFNGKAYCFDHQKTIRDALKEKVGMKK